MPKFINRIIQELASAASSAYAAKVTGDTNDRINIDAGGTVTWGTGASAGDVNLSRSAASVLRTNGVFQSVGGLQTVTTVGTPTLTTMGDGGLVVDTTSGAPKLFFRANSTWNQVTGGGGGGTTTPYQAVFSVVGDLPSAGGTSWVKFWFDGSYTIQSVFVSVGTKPTGVIPIVVDVLKGTTDYLANPVSVFAASASRPSIAAGSATATYTLTGTDTQRTVTSANWITIQVVSVGETIPGSDLVVYVKYV